MHEKESVTGAQAVDLSVSSIGQLAEVVWNMTGISYLSRLEIGEGSAVNGVLIADSEITEALPGVYAGNIIVTP